MRRSAEAGELGHTSSEQPVRNKSASCYAEPAGWLSRPTYHDVMIGIIAGGVDGWFFIALHARAMISLRDSRSSSSELDRCAEGKQFLFR